ncbi:MAG: type IV pilus modification PilV family protein [Candidatus Levyibacteriota bacterium]
MKQKITKKIKSLFRGENPCATSHVPPARKGSLLIEALIAMGLSAILLPALLTGLFTSVQGKAQQEQRAAAIALMKEGEEVVRSVREKGWSSIPDAGVYHPVISGSGWALAAGNEQINGFTRTITVSDVYRDQNGVIVQSGGSLDVSTKKLDITISWNTPLPSSADSTMYVTRFLGNAATGQTSATDFNAGTKDNTQVTNTSGGEITLAPNTKGKWCSPSFSSTTISLPDGPPVSVAATASADLSTPNDIFVATSPNTTNSIKLAYFNVPANIDPPVATLEGTFTLDATKYSSSGLVPTGINLDNSFVTNQVKYYLSSGGNLYALLAITKPDKEVIAIQVKNGDSFSYQDPTNHIFKYWTFFNTRIYQGNSASMPNQDQSPYGWGASSVAVLGDKGYVVSGGFMYEFDLSNIDSKSPSNGLDMVGCRIQLDGYDCNPSTSRVRKYNAGGTGTNFGSESAGQTACVDGGMTQKYADNDIYPVQVGGNTYVYFAVGAGTDPEMDIVNATSVPTGSTSPSINSNSCGTISSGNTGWKRVGSLDFNSKSGTQETANSVFATPDGTRAYISSNGGVDGNHDGIPDAWQLYVIDTTNKSSPHFLSGTASTGATSGYYYGSGENSNMYPRRSLTVFGNSRALLSGVKGSASGPEPQEYQVIDISNEASPTYCGGVNYTQGFNDLASVTEADNDKFVYMVSSSGGNQLKIIQGGPDGSYLDSGTYTSSPLDLGAAMALNRFSADATTSATATITFQFAATAPVNGSCTDATYIYVGPDGTTGTYFPATGGAIPLSGAAGFSNPAQCVRYKAYLSTTDFNVTPSLLDVSVNYSP